MKKLLVSLFVLCLWLPWFASGTPAQASTFWESTFSSQDCNWLNSFDGTCLRLNTGVMQIENSVQHNGVGSLKYYYDIPQVGSCLNGSANFTGNCDGYWDRSITSTSTLWRRFWLYVGTDFEASAPYTKIVKAGANGFSDWLTFNGQNSTNLVMHNQGWPTSADTRILGTSATLTKGQWACIEIGQTLNTPGVANGTFIVYKDGVLVANYSDVGWRLAGDNSLFNYTRVYRQYGSGTMRMSEYAVGDTRIGCGALPPPPVDTTAPAVPTSPTATSNSPGVVTVSWTNGSETDRAGHNIRFCTGTSCTPSAVIGTASANATSASFSGLTEGTLYRFDVNSYDNASPSNQSAYSSIVEATVTSTPSGGGKTLSINASGKFVLNGTQQFILPLSYFDALNYRTSDLDTAHTNGFNGIRIFVNWREDLGSTESVCDAAGALVSARVTTINALIDYAESLDMVVLIVILSENSPSLMTTQTPRLTCVTNVVNAFEAQPLVMFDVVQEHDLVSMTWSNTPTLIKLYTDAAKAACPTCIIYASGTSDPNGIGPQGNISALDATMKANIVSKLGTNGETLLAVHEYRSSDWANLTGPRVAEYLNYLASVGRASTPLIFDEPCRDNGYSTECDNATASDYIRAAVLAKSAGAAMYVWHTAAGFDMAASSFVSQLTVKEATVFAGIAAALAAPTNEVPVLVETCTFSGVLTDCMYAGIETNETPVIVSGQVQAASTSNQSVAVYDGQGATIPSTNQVFVVENTVTRSASPIYQRVGVRMQAGTDYSGYDCRFTYNPSPPDSVELVRKDNDSPVTVAGPIAVTLSLTAPHGCGAYGSSFWAFEGAVGSETVLLGGTDSTYSSGLPYLYLGTFGPATTALKMDNAKVYGFGAPAPPCSPSLTQVVASATGATVTYDTACPPTQIRVNTELNTETLSLASFPGGVYTRPGGWKALENFVQMIALDAQGVASGDFQSDTVSEFVPNPDVTAPVMTFIGPTSELPFGTTSYSVSFGTDESAGCLWATTNIAYTAMNVNNSTTPGLTHSFTATGLVTGANHFYGQCADTAESPNVTSTALHMIITVAASTADTVAPPTVSGLAASAISPSQISITHPTVVDATSNPVSYEAWLSTDGTNYVRALAYTGVPAVLPNLGQNTLHYVKVMALDSVGNPAAAFSNVATATTPIIPDTTVPDDPLDLTAVAFATSVALSWPAGSDDRSAVDAIIEMCSGSVACTAFQVIKTTSNAFGFTVTESTPGVPLTPSTIYRFRFKFRDSAGNVSVNYSPRVAVTTLAASSSNPTSPRMSVPYPGGITAPSRLTSPSRLPRP